MRSTFADRELERRFADQGYLHLPAYFDDTDVTLLRAIYLDLHPSKGPGLGFASDLDWADLELKAALEKCLGPFWHRVFDELLTPHDSLISGYVVKWPGPEGLLPPHAHFSYVAPDSGRSIVVWASIDRIGPEIGNGPLQVLPRSHLVANEYFGSGTRPWYVDRPDAIERGLVTLPTRPGDVVVMDGRLVHGSKPNETSVPRMAMLSEAVPTGLPLFHPVAVGEGTVELRPVDRRVLTDAEPGHVASIFAYYHAPEIARSGAAPPKPLVSTPAPGSRRMVDSHVDESLLAMICPPVGAASITNEPAALAPLRPAQLSTESAATPSRGGGAVRQTLRSAMSRLQRPHNS